MSVWICGDCGTRYSVGAEQCPQCGGAVPREEHASSLSPLASLTVACLPENSGCRYGGVVRRVMLPQIVPGVVAMPDLRCAGCGRHMAAVKEGAQDMPKTTVHGGASNAAAETPEEESSPGTSSSTSPEKEPTSPETSESEAPSPARTTASRSKKARMGSSSAAGTAGGPTAATSDTDN